MLTSSATTSPFLPIAGLILRQPEKLKVHEAALHAEALDRGTARTARVSSGRSLTI